MNKLYFLLAALWLLSLRPAGAQTTDSLRLRLSQVFANVDKSQVPTGRLLEYAEPLLPMEYFDGLRLDDSSRTTMAAWRALYVTAATARVAGTDTLPGLLAFNTRLKAASPARPGAGPVPIAVEYVAYAAVRHDAFSQNLLSIQNEQVYDVAGRTQNPYQRQVLFAAAPAYTISPTGDVSFVFRRNLYLADGSSGTPTLYLDFDDGRGYLPAAWDQPLAAIYTTAGTKHVRVKVLYRGKLNRVVDTRESHFSFEVLEAASPNEAARYAPDSTSRGFTRLISPRPGVHGGALVSVRYGSGNPGGRQILKPLIVVEQYNIARTAPHLVRCNNPNNTAETFLAAITDNTNPFDFNNHLDLAGYDLVYIDFTDNLDYLASNAQLFEEVVRWVNQKKAAAGSTQQNVVMGLSMGGLIARYGLAEMTRRPNDNPDTRLLVLHDSPQRGAYNPLGVQAVTRALNKPIVNLLGIGLFKLSDFSDEFSETVDVMDRGATRDLSILYATNGTGGYTTNSFLEGASSPYRQMVDNVPNPGYTIVATSDGSQCGVTQGIAPGTELSHSAFNLFAYLGPQGILFGNKSVRSDVSAYALPAYGQQGRISYVRIYYDIRLFPWWLPVPISLKINVRPTQEFYSPPNTLPYENLPGGNTMLNEAALCANSFNYTFNGLAFYGMSTTTTFYGRPICFVPTYSALDVEAATLANATARYINNTTTSASQPRVASFIAQQPSSSSASAEYNLNHLAYTARNSEWIFNEIQRPFNGNANSLACNALWCDPANKTIAGPITLCTVNSGPATYTSPLQGPGYTYTWVASPCNAFTVCSGTGPTFQTREATNSGSGTITLTVNTGCQFSFSKQVVLGAPAPIELQEDLVASDPCSKITWFNILNYDPGLSYSGTGMLGGVGAGRFRVKGRPGSQSAAFSITATNNCGTYSTSSTASFPDCGYRYATYPNPADDQLTVEQTDSTSASPATPRGTAARGTNPAPASSPGSPAPSQPYTVRLYDGYGTQQVQQSTTTPTLSLPTGGLPTGLYLLHIEAGGVVVERRRVQITH